MRQRTFCDREFQRLTKGLNMNWIPNSGLLSFPLLSRPRGEFVKWRIGWCARDSKRIGALLAEINRLQFTSGREKMNEKIRELDVKTMEVRCDVCRKTFTASEADTRCPECKIGRIRIMDKAA